MASLTRGGVPAKLKGAGGPAAGYGSDTNAPSMAPGISKSGVMKPKPIKANALAQSFCGGGSVQGGFRNNAMKGRK
jgi:hypothetical protein